MKTKNILNISKNDLKNAPNLSKNDMKMYEHGDLEDSGSFQEALKEHLGAKMALKIANRSPKRLQEGQHRAKMG